MKPTTFESEIDSIFEELVYDCNHITREEAKKQLFSLIQTTIRELLPEKKGYDNLFDIGFNTCYDTITKNLKEKGML